MGNFQIRETFFCGIYRCSLEQVVTKYKIAQFAIFAKDGLGVDVKIRMLAGRGGGCGGVGGTKIEKYEQGRGGGREGGGFQILVSFLIP